MATSLFEAPGTTAASGGSANRQAIMRMNPEQASKVKSWTPIPLHLGEGRRAVGPTPSEKTTAVRRGNGGGMSGQPSTQRERPGRSEGSDLGRSFVDRIVRESEGLIVPLRSWKHDGGKEPCFRSASEATEDRRLA